MKSKLILLPLLLVFGMSNTFAQKQYSLQQLQQDPDFKVFIEANGSYSGNSVELKIESTHKKDVELVIPAGTEFYTSNEHDQILILVNEEVLLIAKEKTRRKTLDAFCTEASDGVPDSEMTMAYMPTKREKLQKLANFLNAHKSFSENEIQEAVWCVSDNQSLAHIYSEDPEKSKVLKQFISDLTGQEMTWHQVRRNHEIVEDRIVSSPVEVSGEVQFKTTRVTTVKSKIIDKEGNLVYDIDNERTIPVLDRVRLNFNITVYGWDPGTYFVIYYDQDNNTILKKEFEI